MSIQWTLIAHGLKNSEKNGAILYKFWDRPVNALAKVCEYVEYRKNIPS